MNREIHFKSPPSSDIVIFEKIGSDRIQNLILPGKPVLVFDSRHDVIFLSFRVVVRFLSNLNHFKINSIKNSSTRLRGIVGQLWRMAKEDDYKGAIQFLCSDASIYLNGAVIPMDGGRSCW